MRHIVSILTENETGALSRIVGLFSQRGYNIESITAAPTEDNTITRITILTHGGDEHIEQITKQLHKLINVIKVSPFKEYKDVVEREILFIKVQAKDRDTRDEIKTLSEIFRAKIVDVTPNQFTIEYVNTSVEIDRFLDIIKQTSEILETVRSGVCGIERGDNYLTKGL